MFMFSLLVFFLFTTLPALSIMRRASVKEKRTMGDKFALWIGFVVVMGFCGFMTYISQHPLIIPG
jgi:hypothetical protein